DSMIAVSNLRQNSEQPWPVFWTQHKNVRLIGSGLALLNHKNEMAVEAAFGERRARRDPSWFACPLTLPTQLSGTWTSIVSQWLPNDQPVNYFHWLFDGLPRLLPLADFSPETKIIIPGSIRPF